MKVGSFDGDVQKLLDKFEIAENLAVNTIGAVTNMAKPVERKGFANLAGAEGKPVGLGHDPLAARSFSARWQARLQQELRCFEAIPLEKIGRYQDELRQSLSAR